MSRFMMGFQVFLTLVFLTGLRLAAGSPERCKKMMEEKRMKYIVNEKEWTVPDKTVAVCKDVWELLRCFNDEVGFDLKRPPDSLIQGDDGYIFKMMAVFARHAEEICTEGGKSNNLLISSCFENALKVKEECRLQSLDGFETFWNSQSKMNISESIKTICINPLYQGGCVGVAVLDECGDEAFDTFSDAVRSIYESSIELFEMNTMCSSEIAQAIMTRFVNSLKTTESDRRVYRRIFDMDQENSYISTPVTPEEKTIGLPVTMAHCREMNNRLTTKYRADNIVWMLSQETDALCTDVMGVLRCYKDVSRSDLKTPPDFLLQSDNGYIFKALAGIVSLVENFCTEGSKVRDLLFSECFGKAIDVLKECIQETEMDFEIFRYTKIKMYTMEPNVKTCILPGYQGGCVGAAVLEECGKESLDTFTDTFRSVYQIAIDFLGMNTLCSSANTRTLKTSFFENLNITESHKSVYRVILNMDKAKDSINNSEAIDINKEERNRGNLLMNNCYLYLLMIFLIYNTEKYLYAF